MNESNQYKKLPPGWDCKYDQATGNCYYVNYFTKAMQLEDPRQQRYKQLQNEKCSTESIAMQQPFHGSPYHVYPSNNLPAMRAFQSNHPQPSLYNMSASPLLSSRGAGLNMSPLPLQKLSNFQCPRSVNMARRSTLHGSILQETSFSNPVDVNATVNKIQNMFPTADENHIRMLLKRYYNREAVVISALQVEKYPVTMPGPFVTPPAQRHLFHSNSAFQMTPPARRPDMGATTSRAAISFASGSINSRTASPIPGGRFGGVMSMQSAGAGVGLGRRLLPDELLLYHGSPRINAGMAAVNEEQWRSSPKPHSSPKMKLRYMKTIFPKADEMLLLEILSNCEDNVQQASDKLLSMGYEKKQIAPQKPPRSVDFNKSKSNEDDVKIIPLKPAEYSAAEKDEIQARLNKKYPQIAERIILMALESVNFAEDRAIQILQIVIDEDEAKDTVAQNLANNQAVASTAQKQQQSQLAHATAQNLDNAEDGNSQRLFGVKVKASESFESNEAFKSMAFQNAKGPNRQLAKGANESLLLADYVTWNGANPENTTGAKTNTARGPNASLLSERSYNAIGRKSELCKGPQVGLAKGSIYAQLNSNSKNNIKCN